MWCSPPKFEAKQWRQYEDEDGRRLYTELVDGSWPGYERGCSFSHELYARSKSKRVSRPQEEDPSSKRPRVEELEIVPMQNMYLWKISYGDPNRIIMSDEEKEEGWYWCMGRCGAKLNGPQLCHGHYCPGPFGNRQDNMIHSWWDLCSAHDDYNQVPEGTTFKKYPASNRDCWEPLCFKPDDWELIPTYPPEDLDLAHL